MGEPWKSMESEMDRFEAEISSLAKPTLIPASVRKPPAPPPPRPKLTPVVISGGPHLYSQPTGTPAITPAAFVPFIRPTQITQRLIRPGLLPGSPPITPSTGHALATETSSSMVGDQSTISGGNSTISTSSTSVDEKPSTSTGHDNVILHSGNSSTSASTSTNNIKNKKKKKKKAEGEKKPKKHLRSAGGAIWEDQTLLDWDPKDFRLFCGDLGNDVTDEVLTRVFGRYPSFVKARVVRDKRSNKTKGYGFVSFKDPQDFVRAIRELDGRYVGSRPIKLRKSTWENRGLTQVRKRDKLQKSLLGIGKSK